MKPKAESPMTEALASIWRRVLQLPSVDIHDDFFDLGGDSSLALQLFNEIARVYGRELPPVTIYQARTIASLVALLDESATPRFPALMQLKPGSKQPPILLAHGLGGTVMDFFQPVRHIGSDRPIYGLQAPGIDGVDEPLERIEDMADFYLNAVRELQPHGPYVLIGYSLGGLIALEMAQRLRSSGEKIALLAMLDAYPHTNFLPLGEQARLLARRIRSSLHSVADLRTSAAYKPPAGPALNPAMQRVCDAAYRALSRYHPRFYAGEIKFIRAAVVSSFPSDAASVWGRFVQKLDVETVPGDHLGMIATHYEELASVLSRYLREAFGSSENA